MRFLGKGTNLLYIRGNCGMYSDEIQIQDIYWYGLESKILSDWNKDTNVSGRAIYSLPLDVGPDDSITMEFKFKSIVSTNISSVLGVFLLENTYDIRFGVTAQYSNLKSYYSSASSNRNRDGNFTSLSSDSVYKMELKNGTCKWYKDNVQFASYSIERTVTSRLRYDLFNSNTSRLEYLKVIL